jgi:hypothetical protein
MVFADFILLQFCILYKSLRREHGQSIIYIVVIVVCIAVFQRGVKKMADLNSSIGPVLDGVILLFPTLLALVLAAIPIILAMALIGFVLGIFDGILSKIKL